jgi:hypothetical protein
MPAEPVPDDVKMTIAIVGKDSRDASTPQLRYVTIGS